MRVSKVLLIFVMLAFAVAPEMKLKRVEKDVYMVRGVDALPSLENRGFMSNAYAVLTKEGWVVIDALSTPELSKEFVQNLQRVKKVPIAYAIITHYHPDHYYGVRTYKELGAKIVAHENLYEYYNSGQAINDLANRQNNIKGLWDSVKLYPPDIVVKDRYVLKVGEKSFEIISMQPAHTNNDLVVYIRKDNILFAGDLVYMNRIPFMGDGTSSSKGWEKALMEIKNLKPRVILAGHNEPLGMDAVDFTLGYIKYVRENVKRLKDEGKFVDEIKEVLSENPYRNLVMYNQFHNANISKVFIELDMEE